MVVEGLAIELRERELDGLFSLAIERLAYGGERGRREAALANVVEPDDGDVFRNPNTTHLQGIHHTNGHEVIGCHNRVEPDVTFVEHLAHGFGTGT